jgi:hypothetical protein
VATYDFQTVLVWDTNPGGVVRLLRNGSVTVYNAATDAALFNLISDSQGLVSFTTTDVPTVYLRTTGWTSEHITAASAVEAAAAAGVSNDAGIKTAIANPTSQSGSYLNSTFAPVAEPVAVAGLANRIQVVEAPLIPERYGAVGDGTTVDDAAFTALAAVANNATGRPDVYLGEKSYRTTIPIDVARAGWNFGGRSRIAGSRIVNAVSDVFTFAAGTAGTRHHFHDFRVTASAGHIFSVANGSFSLNHLERLSLEQSNTGKSILNQTSGDHLDNLVSVVELTGTTGHTVPLYKVLSATGGANENTFERGRSTYSGNYVFWFEETDPAQYSNSNMFQGWNFEVPNGGCIKGLSANGWTIESCNVYDLAGFNGGVSTKDLYHLGKSTGPNSRYNAFKRVVRHGGTLGSGLVDIRLQSGAAPLTRIEQCDLSSGSAGYAIDLGSNSALNIEGCGSAVTFTNRGAGQVSQNNGAAVGLFGKTPVAQAAAITSPTAPSAAYVQAEAAAMKTAVDAIRVALSNIGITA